MTNKKLLKEIFLKIKEYDTIIIHRHIRPDGDCMGSQLGLKELIKASFPEKKVFAVGEGIPDYLSFLGKNDEISDEIYQDALVIVVDTSSSDRVRDDRFKTGKFLIKIDHHDDSEDFGDMNYVDAETPATGSIMVDFYLENKNELNLTMNVAKAFFTAIITDTGRFQYRGVNGQVLRNASILIETGIDIQDIYSKLYLKEFELYKLQGYVYKHFKQTPHGVAYMHFTKRIMRKFGISREDAGSLVNQLSSIKGALIWVAFIDHPDGTIRVRVRSRFLPINDIASRYGGGGHLTAAGATVHNKKEKRSLLLALDKHLAKFKEENPEIE